MVDRNLDYWYDQQIKRYLTQLVRVFSNFQVAENTRDGVNYNRVPCRYGDSTRMVANILRSNSSSVLNSAPFIALSIQSLQVARDRTQEPNLVSTNQVAEREFNTSTGQYEPTQGNLYTTQRYMPVPYNLTIQVDIWTTNTDTKLQILEQIFVLFNPSIQLQSNSNPLDWTSVFEVELTDINWSSRSVPQGVDEQIDVATLSFAVPIWISPPAKVKRQSIIQRIVTDIHAVKDIGSLGFTDSLYDFFDSVPETTEVIVTPGDYYVQISGTTATLLDNADNPKVWNDIIEMQGGLSSTSKLKLNITNDSDDDINLLTGTVSSNPLSSSQLIFNLDQDTLPSSTIAPVDRIINPRENYPGDSLLPSPQDGQRYLITETLAAEGWPNWNIDAKENDIIEFSSTEQSWVVVFDSNNSPSEEFIINNYTSKQFKWTGSMWISSYEGTYKPGFWRLVL
jgi:hypothetical protein